MAQQFTPKQQGVLRERFIPQEDSVNYATAAQGALAATALQPGDAATPAQGSKADTALQPGQAASAAQGAKADTALQPSGNLTGSVNGVPVATVVSQAADGQTAFDWGNHALAGYLTYAPVLRVYQTTAGGSGLINYTIPDIPVAGSEVIVFVAATPLHATASYPPSADQFYRSDDSIDINVTAGDKISIYYMS